VKHINVSPEDKDDVIDIEKELSTIVKRNPNAIIFLVQRSKIYKKNESTESTTKRFISVNLENVSFKDLLKVAQGLANEFELVPFGGHICMAITNSDGEIEEQNQVSWRPKPNGKIVLTGKPPFILIFTKSRRLPQFEKVITQLFLKNFLP
jgi:hypothetical protein